MPVRIWNVCVRARLLGIHSCSGLPCGRRAAAANQQGNPQSAIHAQSTSHPPVSASPRIRLCRVCGCDVMETDASEPCAREEGWEGTPRSPREGDINKHSTGQHGEACVRWSIAHLSLR
jgi:hypothetical protein